MRYVLVIAAATNRELTQDIEGGRFRKEPCMTG
jgi:hypothetical protein